MAHLHPAFIPGGYRHVCMMEGSDPELRLSTLQYDTILSESKRNADEVQRLKALLRQHNIQFDTALPVSIKYVSKNSPSNEPHDGLRPRLPTEILLRILGFALTSPVPIIDPFYKLRIQNVTKVERVSRQYINIQCLSVSQVCKMEGMRILLEQNDFVFTQAAALENFAKISQELRSTIKHVTFRVVGRYYNDEARKADVTGNGCYHDSISKFLVPVTPRPKGMVNDKGMQAYCWFQLADFLRAMQLPREMMSSNRPKLFPGLETMRLDLVNFCDHLPLGISAFAAVVRWHIGRILDELVVTGLPNADASADEQMVLRNLLRDEGLFSAGCPAFISIKEGVKSLPVFGYTHDVVCLKKKKASKKKSLTPLHPEGGMPPKSTFTAGKTIWKWTKERDDGPKQWIEFDRVSGRPMSEVEDEEDEEEDDDDLPPNFATLLGLPLLPIFGPPPPPPVNPTPAPDALGDDEDLDGMPELIDIDG
ncbi:hypothetical protein BKA64DRAFT_748433 [Cadophora sp. MPI-SDFR-AT-0126]|nr:hypothetical protein BKA64DRAFT_748433 [Leotiomycetes sp. MPI-SDFR-AT-0126]